MSYFPIGSIGKYYTNEVAVGTTSSRTTQVSKLYFHLNFLRSFVIFTIYIDTGLQFFYSYIPENIYVIVS